jgi:photosystem II stability/assembly factor-like uncharacterized protein
MKTSLLLVLCLLICTDFAFAQKKYSLQLLYSHDSLSFRGLSVVSDAVLWVSGTKGTVGKSVDGGKSWTWLQVPGYASRDFRDIEAFDAQTAIIMAIAEPAHILKTSDGGKTWKVVFADSTQGMFLDAMHFRDSRNGIVVGDPVNGNFFLKGTNNGGDSWSVNYPETAAKEGEACFASSGSNILELENGGFVIVSGGKESHWLQANGSQRLPLIQGKETTGANSVASWQQKKYVVVGGDFQTPTDTTGNCVRSDDGGLSWQKPVVSPHGYRSCVVYMDENTLLSCGTSGVDISVDGGQHWQLISTESYHVCQVAKKGKAVFLAGSKGKIARLVVDK